MSTSSIKVYQCMHSPYCPSPYCVWMKSQGRKSKKLYFLSHQSKYCYIYYNFVHIYETLGISTSQPHHSRQLIVYIQWANSFYNIWLNHSKNMTTTICFYKITIAFQQTTAFEPLHLWTDNSVVLNIANLWSNWLKCLQKDNNSVTTQIKTKDRNHVVTS